MESSWYDPARHGQRDINLRVQQLTDNTFVEREYLHSSRKAKQPEKSDIKHCTAAMVHSHITIYMEWFVIPCRMTFVSTYICQYNKVTHNATIELQNPNLPCPKGWFQVDGVSKCYMTVKSSPTTTFKIAENQCRNMNSSLLNIEVYDTTIFMGLAAYKKTVVGSADTTAVIKNVPLLNFFRSYCDGNDVYMGILAAMNETCVIGSYSGLSLYWTVELCRAYTQADIFICEKPSSPTSTTCDLKYYQCLDGTCVLMLYVCDSVNDCVDGEDEIKCPSVVTGKASLSLQNDSLYLPCPLYHICNSSESLVTPVKIHTICDGINAGLNNINEHDMCIQRNIATLDLHSLITDTHPKMKYIGVVKKKYNSLQLVYKNYTHQNITMKDELLADEPDFKIPCHNSEHSVKLADMCQVVPSVKQCALKFRHRFCKLMLCPGMFKCGKPYCIYMSHVCDGHMDCPYGDDENFCSNLVCPGFLKCRGESRCISPQQICDGHVDCISSFDDEIQCDICPKLCKCVGYLLYCELDNTLGNVTHVTQVYSKALIFSGVQSTFALDMFITLSGIYLDISRCEIKTIVFSTKSQSLHQNLLFADFGSNQIIEIKFLLAEVLSNVIVLDLSYNYITVLTYTYFRLTQLVVLYIRNNPLTVIEITSTMTSFKYGDLQGIHFNWRMKVNTNNYNVEIAVTDSMVCCLWPKQVKCRFSKQNERCHGLIKNSIKGILLITLNILATALAAFVSTRTVYQLVHRKYIKRNFNIAKLNFMGSSLFVLFSLVGLSALGMTQINIITWRKSIGCHIINGIMSLSLGTMFFLKTTALFLVAMKLIFPFAHQCRWLNGTYLICCLMNLICVLLYIVNICISKFIQIDDEFDKFCTIGDCHIRGFYRVMYYFICSIDLFCLIFFVAIFRKVAIVVKEKNKVTLAKKVSLLKVLGNFTRQIVPQFLFMFFLYSIFLVKVSTESTHENYCSAVFLFVLPLVIILDSILGIMM